MKFEVGKFYLFLLKNKEYSANMVQAIFFEKSKQEGVAAAPGSQQL